ncbi:hypothetical protein KP509_02G105500 [Ceratopteris richardii]|uniref:Transmembrane protein 135 N-terminal domain-containing protein n=1 Tax=Ceratopteris richardii TaxID=49495 RepID=A0A8T2V9E6_CERRI|nr:hypothetical protein KP509_02G105500 [Ceratopteris richardii]
MPAPKEEWMLQQRAALASQEKEAALKRLREAEVSLRKAVEDLHANHAPGEHWYSSFFSSRHTLCQHLDSCIANSISSFCQSFLLANGVRVGIGVLLRAFKLAKNKSFRSLLDLKLLVSEKDLIVREEACRIGLLFGGFTGCYHGIRCILRRLRKKETILNEFFAGCIAGLSILTLDDQSKRRTLALYILARLAQCIYNLAKARKKFHFWGSHWQHGDSLLFSLACAQVMYAFVMRPETLPESYLEFIVRTGPISRPVLKAVRESCRGEPVDVDALSAFLSSNSNAKLELATNCRLIPCTGIHAGRSSCMEQTSFAARSAFKKTFPLYMSLTFVPFVVLNLQKGFICLHRKIAVKDHKLIYWFAGAIAALAVLLEKKSRRSELALYVLPRAADSLWYILVNRQLLPNIKYAEVVLFCLCMGGIMCFHEHEPDMMAPLLRGIIKSFMNRVFSTDQSQGMRLDYPAVHYVPYNAAEPAASSTIELPASEKGLRESPGESCSDVLDKLETEAFDGL